jgi:hypothetical protein
MPQCLGIVPNRRVDVASATAIFFTMSTSGSFAAPIAPPRMLIWLRSETSALYSPGVLGARVRYVHGASRSLGDGRSGCARRAGRTGSLSFRLGGHADRDCP